MLNIYFHLIHIITMLYILIMRFHLIHITLMLYILFSSCHFISLRIIIIISLMPKGTQPMVFHFLVLVIHFCFYFWCPRALYPVVLHFLLVSNSDALRLYTSGLTHSRFCFWCPGALYLVVLHFTFSFHVHAHHITYSTHLISFPHFNHHFIIIS